MPGLILVVAAIASTSASVAIAAGEQPICAARPGTATAACTVPAGHVQLEIGLADWSVQNARGERDTAFAIGETGFKYGLTDRSDIEVDMTPWEGTNSRAGGGHDTVSGFGDVVVSYKWQVSPRNSALQITRLPFVKVPTARHELGNGKWEAGLLVPIGYAIPKTPFSINLTPEIDWAADASGEGHHAAMAQSREPLLAGQSKAQPVRGALGPVGLGSVRHDAAIFGRRFDRLPGDNDVQLDAGANFGLNRETPDVELYTGVSVRF